MFLATTCYVVAKEFERQRASTGFMPDGMHDLLFEPENATLRDTMRDPRPLTGVFTISLTIK